MRLSPGRGSAALAAALVLFPADASSQLPFRDFGVQCTTSSFRACVSVRAWNEVDAATGDYVLFVQMANMQGSAGLRDLRPSGLGAWGLTNLSVHNLHWAGDPLPPDYELFDRIGDFSSYGKADGQGNFICDGPNGAGCDALASGRTGAGGEHWLWGTGPIVRLTSNLYSDPAPLFGCDFVEEPAGEQAWGAYYSTCGGTVTYRMHLGFGVGLTLTDETEWEMNAWTNDPSGNEQYASCRGAACSTVTPEPVTMVLLGSGLFAMGGAGALRRKRHEDGDEG